MNSPLNSHEKFTRIPKHIGIIPDGNRRWALNNQLEKQDGYAHGVEPGVRLYQLMLRYGVREATFYGFTKDNTNRPAIQTQAYAKACVDAVNSIAHRDANVLVVGKADSPVFPDELQPYANKRVPFGQGLMNVNFLVNYDWGWDLNTAITQPNDLAPRHNVTRGLASKEISRVDLIIRWGGRTRLSGFLPVQSVYADFYVVDDYWPDFKDEHFINALKWYQTCDVTLGG